MCCRLRLDLRSLERRGGLFGANPLTGSVGVVTINMPRLGYRCGTEEEFLERLGELEGVIGVPTKATARKAKRPIAAILRYLTLLVDQILETFPPGTVPPVEKVTLRTAKEMEPFLKEPQSDGWKSVYELPHIGPFHKA